MKTKSKWMFWLLAPILTFSMQGPVLTARLKALGCTVLNPQKKVATHCVDGVCRDSYALAHTKRFLVVGHIVKTHSVFDSVSKKEIYPISGTKSLPEDKWPELFVYDAKDVGNVNVEVSYPENSAYNGFSGVYPRECANEGVIRAITMPSVMTSFSKVLLATLVLFAFFAARIAGGGVENRYQDSFEYLSICFSVYILSFLLGDHFFDALKSNFRFSQDSLRTLGLVGILLPVFGVFGKKQGRILMIASVFVSLWISEYSRLSILGGLTPYRIAFPIFTLFALGLVLVRREIFSFVLLSPLILDTLHIFSGIGLPDFPPIYWNIFVLGGWVAKTAWYQGAGELLPIAMRAAELIKTNFGFRAFSRSIDDLLPSDGVTESRMYDALERSIRLIPKSVSCGRVSILLLPSEGAPVILTYDQKGDRFVRFDDGKVEGYIFSRLLIYKDFFWFRTIADLREDGHLKLEGTASLEDARYFCALPLMNGNSLVGAISLTRFDDKRLEDQSSGFREQLKLQIELVKNRLESLFQAINLSDLEKRNVRSASLLKSLDSIYLWSGDEKQFLHRVIMEIAISSKAVVLAFSRISEKEAVLVDQVGLSAQELAGWTKTPLNLNKATGNKIGPFIVAFNESKSSYVKKISDVFEQLHPYSQELFKSMQAESVITVPVNFSDRQHIIAIISRKDIGVLSHSWLETIESLKPMIVASSHSLQRASSVEAYGKIASRFIDDEITRNSLLDLAKTGDLPATVGREMESILIVVDILGSSSLTDEPKRKAERYGEFYNSIGRIMKAKLGLAILKRAGDGVIIGGILLDESGDLKESLIRATRDSIDAAKDLGFSGARVCVHFGKYFIGLIGTDSSGSLDAIGLGVDHAFKLEDAMKGWKAKGTICELGISAPAMAFLLENGVVFDEHSLAPTGESKYFGKYYLFKFSGDLTDGKTVKSINDDEKKVA
jgi:hypothetical protein